MKDRLPLVIAMTFLFLLCVIILNISQNNNNGKFLYTLDDAYIHMAMAKNLVNHGVFGINSSEFSSSSSSPVWTLLISLLFFISGVNDFIPLLLNIMLANLILYLVFQSLEDIEISRSWKTFFLIFFILILPIPALIFTGLEHLLHIVLIIIFLKLLFSSMNSEKNNIFYLYIISSFICFIRYESMFLIFLTVLLFIWKKKYLESGIIIFLTLIPQFIFGFYSMSQGWYFFPNSVILKSKTSLLTNFSQSGNFIVEGIKQSIVNLHILLPLLLVLILFFAAERKMRYSFVTIYIMITGVYILHMFLARSGWFCVNEIFLRYDSYILAMVMVLFLISLKEKILRINSEMKYFKIIIFCILLSITAVTMRGLSSLSRITGSMSNVYDQHYQMALFVDRFYKNGNIAVHDIGAVNYFTECNCIDLMGLANKEVGRSIRDGIYTAHKKEEIIKKNNIRLIMIYPEIFEREQGKIPDSWINIASWKIPDNIIFHEDTISLYTPEIEESRVLKERILEFSETFSSRILIYFN